MQVSAKLQNKLLQIGNNGFPEILFFIVFRNIQEFEHIGISQRTNCRMFLNKVVMLGCRKHSSFIKHAVDLPFKLTLAVSVSNAESQMEFFCFICFATGHDKQIVRLCNFSHQWWEFFVILVGFIKLLHPPDVLIRESAGRGICLFKKIGEILNNAFSPAFVGSFLTNKHVIRLAFSFLLWYSNPATQINIVPSDGFAFYFSKSASSTLAYLSEERICVAAIGALHFSVRSFGCALFIFRRNQNETAHSVLATYCMYAL